MAIRKSSKKAVKAKSGTFVEPNAADLVAAKAAKAEAAKASADEDFRPGRVRGLDYSKWASAVVDLSELEHNPQRVHRNRVRLEGKGYTLLEGEPIVDGFEEAEAWVKPRDVWMADREARNAKIRAAQSDGYMSDTASLKSVVTGPHGRSVA